jgi:hypothetical protein
MIVAGVIFVVIGLLLCVTIVGAIIGGPMIFLGCIFLIVGALSRRKTTITNVVQVSTMPGLQQAQVPADVDAVPRTIRNVEPPVFDAQPVPRPAQATARRLEGPVVSYSSEEPNGYSYDRKKWDALVEYDDDIKRVAVALQPYGSKYIDQFAAAYLALNDKEYLPVIIKKIIATAKQDLETRRS